MRIHVDNTGVQIDPPAPIGPCQSLSERMGPEPVSVLVAGTLSEEHAAILHQPDTLDRREFNLAFESGEGLAAAFLRAASSATSPLYKSADFEQADAVLRDFRKNHDKKTLSEQLGPLVEKACAKLSTEHGELLRKAHAVLDLSVLSYFLGQAFA
jgi:hypothetical protein